MCLIISHNIFYRIGFITHNLNDTNFMKQLLEGIRLALACVRYWSVIQINHQRQLRSMLALPTRVGSHIITSTYKKRG